MSITDAGKYANFSERHARRKLKEPELQKAAAERRAEHRSEATPCSTTRAKAVAELEALLDAEDPRIRLNAVRTTLSMVGQMGEREALEARVRELEDMVAEVDDESTLPPITWPAQ